MPDARCRTAATPGTARWRPAQVRRRGRTRGLRPGPGPGQGRRGAALGIRGDAAARSRSGVVFLAYLDQVLLPELRRTRPDAVLVLDNLRAHKTAAVRRLLDRSGLLYRYLPAYSPDLNPIEPAWAKVKAELRRVAARTAEALHQALGPALDTITAQDAAGFFRHAGYSRPN